MTNIKFTFEEPLLLLLIIPALLLILIPFLRSPERRRRTLRRILSLLLHSVIAVILVFILSGFALVIPPKQSVVIVADLSYSTSPLHETIIKHANSLLSYIDSEDTVGVVVFAKESVYVLDTDQKLRHVTSDSLAKVELSGGETNIASAIEYAASLLPGNTAKRIILLSDGKQTEGDAEAVASLLASHRIRIDATYFDTTDKGFDEVQLGGVSVKHHVLPQKEVTLSLDVLSNVECDAKISVFDNEAPILEKDVVVKVGSNVYDFLHVPDSQGFHSFRFVIEAEKDTVKNNNEALSYLYVHGQANVLLITNDAEELQGFKEIISEDAGVTTLSPGKAPVRTSELCRYNTVILANVSASELPVGFGETLKEYVSVYGGNLLTLGGKNTYSYGSMMGTVYEEIMPVELSLSEHDKTKTYATMFLVDCSLSMIDETAITTKLQLAKQGTVFCIEKMTDNVSVGLIAFGQEASVKFPLTPMTDEARSKLSSTVSSLGIMTGSGTSFRPALELAYARLFAVKADVKHIILVSDGEPRDRDFLDVISEGRRVGITVSTIGLGSHTNIMAQIAESGGGIYHHVPVITDLPSVMLRETQMIGVEPMIVKRTSLVFGKMSDVFEGLDSSMLPAVDGYIGSTVKKGATEHVLTSDGHPIIASHKLGRGAVTSFMSDMRDEWCSEWLSSDNGKALIRKLLDSTVSSESFISSMSSEYTVDADNVIFSVMTAERKFNHSVTLTLHRKDVDVDHELLMTGYDQFNCSVKITEAGVYPYTLTYSTDGAVTERTQGAIVIPYSSEYDIFAGSGKNLLYAICKYSGGIVTSSVSYLATVRSFSYDININPVLNLGVIAVCIFILELIIRKFSARLFISLFKKRR